MQQISQASSSMISSRSDRFQPRISNESRPHGPQDEFRSNPGFFDLKLNLGETWSQRERREQTERIRLGAGLTVTGLAVAAIPALSQLGGHALGLVGGLTGLAGLIVLAGSAKRPPQ